MFISLSKYYIRMRVIWHAASTRFMNRHDYANHCEGHSCVY